MHLRDFSEASEKVTEVVRVRIGHSLGSPQFMPPPKGQNRIVLNMRATRSLGQSCFATTEMVTATQTPPPDKQPRNDVSEILANKKSGYPKQ